jgi:hypothetical protein
MNTKCEVWKCKNTEDIRPFPKNRVCYIPYNESKSDFHLLCQTCWNNKLLEDNKIYTLKGFNEDDLFNISWDNPTGKTTNTIITNNYITNNYTTNNEIVNDNKHIITNTSNYHVRTIEEIHEVEKVICKKNSTANFEAKNQAYIEKAKRDQELFEEKVAKEQKQYEDMIRKQIQQQKMLNRMERQKIQNAIEAYPDVDEKDFQRCIKCKDYKPPDEFKNSRGLRRLDCICTECNSSKADQELLYRKAHTITCKCGISYVCSSEKCKQKHEESDKHKKHMECILKFNGSKYNIKQLRQICVENKIANSSRMSKTAIVESLNKLKDVIIPAFKE